MELKGSILYSQVLATCPYPAPDPSSNLIISEYSHILKSISFLNVVCVFVYMSPQKEIVKCILITNELHYCSLDIPAGWEIINFFPDWLTRFVICQVFAKHIQYCGDVIFLCTTWANISGQCSSVTGHVQWKTCWNMERSKWNHFCISYNKWLAAISNEHFVTSNFLSSKSSLHCTSNKCVCAHVHAHTHTHTHIYIYMYMCVCVWV